MSFGLRNVIYSIHEIVYQWNNTPSSIESKIQSWDIGDKGLKYERLWMLTDEKGHYVNLLKCPNLHWVKPSFDFDAGVLVLEYPEMPSLKLPLEIDQSMAEKSTCFYRARWDCFDCGDEASNWCSEVTGKDNCRIVRITETGRPGMHEIKQPNEKLAFSSQAQFQFQTEKSLEWLSGKLNEKYDLDEDCEEFWTPKKLMSRFRANFLLEGTENELDETEWTSLEMCGAMFKIQGNVKRCDIVNIDEDTLDRSHEPMKIVSEIRGSEKLDFGIYAAHLSADKNTKLKVSSEVRVFK